MGAMMVDGDCPQGEVPPPPRRSGAWRWPGSLRVLKREGLYIQSSADDLANLITWRFPITVAELSRRALDLVRNWCRIEKLSVQTKAEIGFCAKSKKVDGFVENVLLNGVIRPGGSAKCLVLYPGCSVELERA
jgi:hypothetical protein